MIPRPDPLIEKQRCGPYRKSGIMNLGAESGSEMTTAIGSDGMKHKSLQHGTAGLDLLDHVTV